MLWWLLVIPGLFGLEIFVRSLDSALYPRKKARHKKTSERR